MMPHIRIVARPPRRAPSIQYREPRASQFAALDGPPPGSFRAWVIGCRCSRTANSWGGGLICVSEGLRSRRCYAVAPDCPIHAPAISARPAA